MARFDGKSTFRPRAREQYINAQRRRRQDRQGALLPSAAAIDPPLGSRRRPPIVQRALVRPRVSPAARAVASNNAFNRESIAMFDVVATVPDAPVITSATAGVEEATVVFSAPVSDGGSAVTDYVIQYQQVQWPTSIDATNHHILDQHGNPMPLAIDTGWSLASQLDDPDFELYLDLLRAAGFNASLLSIPEPYFTDNTPAYANDYGESPWTGTPWSTSLNSAYWDRIEAKVEYARQRGITLIICPQYLGFNSTEGWQDEIQTAYTANPAHFTTHGAALVSRFASFPNIVWMFGHDTTASGDIRAASKLIKDELESGTSHLIMPGGYHPGDGASFWTGSPSITWDLNTYYDNATTEPDWETVITAELTTEDAVVAIEPRYEAESTRGIGDEELRRAMWIPWLAGAAGVAFGTNARWHGNSGKEIFPIPGDPDSTWQETFTDPTYNVGTVHAGAFRKLLDQIPGVYSTLPDSTGTFVTAGTAVARFSADVGIAYSSGTGSITLDTTEITGTGNVRIRRYDPTTGEFVANVAASEAQNATRSITHPGVNGAGANDWIYVVQLASVAASDSQWTTFTDGTSTSTTIVVTGLTAGTDYIFRVAAVNAVGQGAYSEPSLLATPTGAAQNIDIPTAILNLTGVAPALAGSGATSFTVPTAALTLSPVAPSIAGSGATSFAVPPADLVLAPVAPAVSGAGAASLAVPPADLILSSVAPSIAGSGATSITVPDGAVSLSGVSPAVSGSGATSLAVPVADLTLAGVAPSISAPAEIAIPTGVITLSPVAPSVSGSGAAALAVPTAHLALAPIAPAITATGAAAVDVPPAALALTPLAPTVAGAGATDIAVPPADLTLTGVAPAIAAGDAPQSIDIPTAILSLSGVAPSIAGAGAIAFDVPTATVAITPVAPTVAGSGSTNFTIPPAALTLAPIAPTVSASGSATIDIPPAALTLAPVPPTISGAGSTSFTVPIASLTLTGVSPAVVTGAPPQSIDVPTATLSLSALAPTLAASGSANITVPPATLALSGVAPSIAGAGSTSFTIPIASLTLVGVAPDVSVLDAPQSIAIPTALLSLTALPPGVAGVGAATISIPAAGLTLTGIPVTLTAAGTATLAIPAAELILAGVAPELFSGDPVHNVDITIEWAGVAISDDAPGLAISVGWPGVSIDVD